MYTISELVTSGVGAGLVAASFGLIGGLRSAIAWGRRVFLSVGMYMLFLAWLQFINFDGGWPADQPPDQEVYRWQTKTDEQRIWNAIGDDLSTMTARDWDDYHRCSKLNVCVRNFQGQRREVGKALPVSSPSMSSTVTQPKFASGNSSSTTETRCVLMDGVLKCHEYIRR